MAHTFNPSTQEEESGRLLSLRPAWSTKWVPGQPELYRETLSTSPPAPQIKWRCRKDRNGWKKVVNFHTDTWATLNSILESQLYECWELVQAWYRFRWWIIRVRSILLWVPYGIEEDEIYNPSRVRRWFGKRPAFFQNILVAQQTLVVIVLQACVGESPPGLPAETIRLHWSISF